MFSNLSILSVPIACYSRSASCALSLIYTFSLTPPFFFIEVPIPNQEDEQSCICLSTIFLLEFWGLWNFFIFLFFTLSNYSWMKSWSKVLYLIYVQLQLPVLQIKNNRKLCSVSICLNYLTPCKEYNCIVMTVKHH